MFWSLLSKRNPRHQDFSKRKNTAPHWASWIPRANSLDIRHSALCAGRPRAQTLVSRPWESCKSGACRSPSTGGRKQMKKGVLFFYQFCFANFWPFWCHWGYHLDLGCQRGLTWGVYLRWTQKRRSLPSNGLGDIFVQATCLGSCYLLGWKHLMVGLVTMGSIEFASWFCSVLRGLLVFCFGIFGFITLFPFC